MSLKRMFIAGAFAATAAVTSAVQAHAKLQASEPQANSTLASAPKQVRLTFNEALEPAFSKIRVTDDKNAEIAIQRTDIDKADQSVMSAQLPPLASGRYHVQWTTMTHDGHKAKGDFTFQIK